MAEFPALTIWTDAYLADTTHLSTIEHGAYLLLLFAAWRSRDCLLPNDDKLLAQYCHLGPRQWQRIKTRVLSFWKLKEGSLYNRRLSDERVAVIRHREQRSDAGKASALKRLNRGSTAVEIPFNENPTPYSVSIPVSKRKNLREKKPTPLALLADFDEFWKIYPKKSGKKAALQAYEKARRDGAEAGVIYFGVEAYKGQRSSEDPRFTKNPATWLNQGCWMDEAPKMNGNGHAKPEPTAEQWARAEALTRELGLDHH